MSDDTQVVSLELLEKESQSLAVSGDLKTELAVQLSDVSERIPIHVGRATALVVKTEADKNVAQSYLDEINKDAKTILDKAGALTKINTLAHAFHKRLTSFESQFITPLDQAKREIKSKMDAWIIQEQRRAEAERARLQAIEEEKARKEREKQEQIAAAARAKEQEALRKAEEARRQAEQASAEERTRLLKEAQKAEAQAAAAQAKAQEREERAAAVVTTQVMVDAPSSRKNARTQWKVKRFNMDLLGIPKHVQGFVTVEVGKLERMKSANSLFEIAGVEFEQRII